MKQVIEFKERKYDLTTTPSSGEALKIQPFTATFAINHPSDDKWIISETKYGIKIAEGETRKEAINKASTYLKSNFIANDIHSTPQESFDAALKFRMRQAVKEVLRQKYMPVLEQAYGNGIQVLYTSFWGFNILKFADAYYPEHATNDKSLKQMITEDKGARIAAIVKALL